LVSQKLIDESKHAKVVAERDSARSKSSAKGFMQPLKGTKFAKTTGNQGVPQTGPLNVREFLFNL
jgi:hypothetical protein